MTTALQLQLQDLITVLRMQRNDAEDEYANCYAMNLQLMRERTSTQGAVAALTKKLEETRQALVTANDRLTGLGELPVELPDAFPPNDPGMNNPPLHHDAAETS